MNKRKLNKLCDKITDMLHEEKLTHAEILTVLEVTKLGHITAFIIKRIHSHKS